MECQILTHIDERLKEGAERRDAHIVRKHVPPDDVGQQPLRAGGGERVPDDRAESEGVDVGGQEGVAALRVVGDGEEGKAEAES